MKLEHVSSEIEENRNGRKKQLLTKTFECSTKGGKKKDLAESLF